MKLPRTKVQEFLTRVPEADAATIATALRMEAAEVGGLIEDLRLEAAGRAILARPVVVPPELLELTLRQRFEAFTAAALELAATRPPMAQTSARTSVEEMREAFAQLCDELGEGRP